MLEPRSVNEIVGVSRLPSVILKSLEAAAARKNNGTHSRVSHGLSNLVRVHGVAAVLFFDLKGQIDSRFEGRTRVRAVYTRLRRALLGSSGPVLFLSSRWHRLHH